jgi:hypothetical protein
MLRFSALVDDALQHSCDALAGHARVRFQRQALARERIYYAKHAHALSGGGNVACKINGPLLIWGAQLRR